MKNGDPFGLHRVIEPRGVLPQAAFKLDNKSKIYANEILLDVDILNITSASFSRIKKEVGTEETVLGNVVKKIVEERGKYQDPVLGSGGMLVGRVAEIGDLIKGRIDLRKGDRVATLVSLTATPLKIDEILKVNPLTDQVWIKGKAVLFERGIYALIPEDLPLEVSLAVMDVAGAPAMVAKTAKAGDTVTVLGGGKAGLLCLYEAKKRCGITGKTIAIEVSQERCDKIMELNLADATICADVNKPTDVLRAVEDVTEGELSDFTVNVVNVENSEMASILSTKDTGEIFFFNMATNFSKAALGAESVGKQIKMLIGNGYVPGHAEITFQILRDNNALREFFEKMYA